MQQCHCEKCAKYLKDDAAFCEFFWGVLYDIAERIQKEKIPGILTVAAYGRPGHVIPKRPMPSNVELMICPQGPWEIGRKSVYERGKARVKAWAEYAGKKISFWNYPGKYAGQLAGVPHITPNAIGAYYKEMAPWYKGGYVNSASDRYYNNVLNLYIFGKVAWDNQADVRALLDEYYRRMFGPAADTMRKIDERIEDLWLHKVLKEPMNTPLGMLSREATDHEIWTEIYSPREREQFKAQFDLAEKQCASDPDSLKRVRLVRTNLLDPLLKCGEKYDQMAAALARFVLYTDPLEKGETIKVDGILDEPAWKNAKEIGLQKIILPGGKDDPSEKPDRSRVYVTGDAKNLYIAFELAEPKMKEVSAPRRARGDKGIWSDNAFEIFLNPSGDRRNYYQFTLNSSGSFALVKHSYVSGFDLMDANWTPRWSFKIVSGSDRWSGEIAIPRAEIGMTKADSFVANFTRHQKRKDRSMYYSWSPFLVATRTSPFQDVDHYGTVVFGRDPRKNLLLNGDFSQKLRSGVYYVGNGPPIRPRTAKWMAMRMSSFPRRGASAFPGKASSKAISAPSRPFRS